MACRRIFSEYLAPNSIKRVQSLNILASRCFSKESEIDEVTHTGQVFAPNDIRNLRFKNSARYVNKSWAIDLIDDIPPKEVTERVVYCDGGDPHLGHPKVYINLDKPGPQACGYCGLRFVRKDDHHH